MSAKSSDMDTLIRNSSLGEPGAVALRSRTPPAVTAKILESAEKNRGLQPTATHRSEQAVHQEPNRPPRK